MTNLVFVVFFRYDSRKISIFSLAEIYRAFKIIKLHNEDKYRGMKKL